MNVWVSRINSDEFTRPGDREWDKKKMHAFWAKVWLDCKELSQHLQQFEDIGDHLKQMVRPDEAVLMVHDELVPEDA